MTWAIDALAAALLLASGLSTSKAGHIFDRPRAKVLDDIKAANGLVTLLAFTVLVLAVILLATGRG